MPPIECGDLRLLVAFSQSDDACVAPAQRKIHVLIDEFRHAIKILGQQNLQNQLAVAY